MNRWIIAFSGALGACAVGLGALGAHLWRSQLPPETYATLTMAITYMVVHAVVVLGVGILVGQFANNRWFKAAALLLMLGIILFSGGLILRSVTGLAEFGHLTPYGGIALILGWLTISLGGIFNQSSSS
jgi:uncharacterized membrane protein YgdD (TMEM256/DUF423 family)